jgi:hypothetical protein
MTTAVIDREAAALEGYVEVTKEQADLIAQLGAARKNESGWKKHKESVTQKVKDVLAGAKGATHEGRVLVTVNTRNGRRTVDLDKLEAVYPEAYAACVGVGAPQTVLELPKR